MSTEIKKLDSHTASKIAAGEVVEKPVNAVKELMENALDAGAAKISIELTAGGLEMIRVTDNGRGIRAEDLPLSVERFATSKAATVEDVYNISTFGFRGEALAAISSVSQTQIKTYREGDQPSEINVDYGQVSPVRPSAMSKGTQVTVSKLFHNLPVRRKFLKSERGSEAEVLRFVKHFAVVNPKLEIVLTFDGDEIFRTYPSMDMLGAAKLVFGEDNMMYSHKNYKGVDVFVCASHPVVQRKRRDSIYIGVNGRVIKDQALTQAVVQAYHRLIPTGTYPAAAVNIRIDPASVDVNIHPTKSEVRFESPSELFTYVKNTTEDVSAKFSMSAYEEVSEATWMLRERSDGRCPSIPDESYLGGFASLTPNATVNGVNPQELSMSGQRLAPPAAAHGRALFVPHTTCDTECQEATRTLPVVADNVSPTYVDEHTMCDTECEVDIKIIGQFDNTYIICETPQKDLIVIDQHAAHERILFDKYTNEKTGSVPSIVLFEAVILNNLTTEELEVLKNLEIELNSFGYSFESFGANSIKVTRVPLDISKKDVGVEFLGIIHDAVDMRKSKIHDSAILTMSCRNAVKAGDTLSPHDMQYIVQALFAAQNPHTCPHGRPILFTMPKNELAGKFQRA